MFCPFCGRSIKHTKHRFGEYDEEHCEACGLTFLMLEERGSGTISYYENEGTDDEDAET